MSYSRDNDRFWTISSYAVIPLLLLWEGYVTAKLWKWFLVEPFGIKPIDVGLAVGLQILGWALLGFTSWGKKLSDSLKDPPLGIELMIERAYHFGLPLLALVYGWVVHEIIR